MPKGVLNCSIEGRMFHRYVVSYTGEHTFNVGMHDVFVTMVSALDSAAAQAVGIVRRASNYGLTGNGASNVLRFTQANVLTSPGFGLTRWDAGSPPGQNAWVVYEFTQATVPFWVLVQFSTMSIDFSDLRLGESPGAPGSSQSIKATSQFTQPKGHENRESGVHIAIGIMPDGSSPWNGTTNNNGADTKSTPVWKRNATKFPRSNDDGAWEFLNSSRMIPLIHDDSIVNWQNGTGTPNTNAPALDAFNMLYHVIFDQNNLLIFFDVNGQGSAGSIFYFGKFRPNNSGNTVPYICLFRNSCFDDSFHAFTTADTAATTYVPYGAVHSNTAYHLTNYPGYHQAYLSERQLINGGVYHPARQHAVGCILVLPPHMNTDMRQIPNTQMLHDNSGKIKHMTAYPDIFAFEFSNKHGFLGRIEFFKIVKNVRTGHFFSDSELIIGNPSMASNKMIIPWDPNTEYGKFGNRFGTVWA